MECTEGLENYFIENGIEDGRKKIYSLNEVGPSTYRLIKMLALPRTPNELEFDAIVERVNLRFNPKPSPIVRRLKFNTRGQKEGESVSEFVAALRKLAEHCEFGAVLDDMLRDRIVCGIKNKKTQQCLLQEVGLSYTKAYDLAIEAETPHKNSERLRDQSLLKGTTAATERKHAVNRVREDKSGTTKPRWRKVKPQPRPQKDNRCGDKHQPSQR